MADRKTIWQRFLKDQRGVAAIEFGLAGILILILGLGLSEFGLLVKRGMDVSTAARTGAQLGIKDQDPDNIETVAKAATDLTAAKVTVTSSTVCECPDDLGTTIDCGDDPADECVAATEFARFIQVTVSYSHTLLYGFPGMPNPFVIERTVIIRYV
jgi:Flp pilus assembly protein TadG